uniref:Druantia anti-phage system protein DruA n=1 Tax=Parerythrobacter lutipelagi TaxID=1964208 RepID=UPI0010F7E735|nr:Druantia anti-phage system protein DruA [Parerythrobacter lutipelagi]
MIVEAKDREVQIAEHAPPDSGTRSDFQIRGLTFNDEKIETVRRVLNDSRGRTHASQILCREFSYRQQNGKLKETAMRDVLRRLEERGLVELPPPLVPLEKRKAFASSGTVKVDQTKITPPVYDLRVHKVGDPIEAQLWNGLVEEFHYLGRKPLVGRNLRQLVFFGNRPIACLAWADPCLRIQPRDEYLATNDIGGSFHEAGVNNTRFLILPWVRVPNLASRVLSLATKHAMSHWRKHYRVELRWAETFVDPTLFRGTCYLASNWRVVGVTKGTARSGRSDRRQNHGRKKLILVRQFPSRRKRI